MDLNIAKFGFQRIVFWKDFIAMFVKTNEKWHYN